MGTALLHCALQVGKPVLITRVVDTMAVSPRPTRAEATDVANAVLDGVDGILLGQETLRGFFPIESVQTLVSIARQAEKVRPSWCCNSPYYTAARVSPSWKVPCALKHHSTAPWCHQRLVAAACYTVVIPSCQHICADVLQHTPSGTPSQTSRVLGA